MALLWISEFGKIRETKSWLASCQLRPRPTLSWVGLFYGCLLTPLQQVKLFHLLKQNLI
jgi:hypothetical protein